MGTRERNIACMAGLVATISGCSGGSGRDPTSGAPIADHSTASQTLQVVLGPDQPLEVAPVGPSWVSLKGPPSTICRMMPVTSDSPDEAFEVVTDPNGVGEFEFEPDGDQALPWELRLDCPTKDAIVRSSVTIVSTETAAARSSAIVARSPPGLERPALTGDLARFTQEYLTMHGYPLRPDPSSKRFTKWVEDVSKPRTMIKPAHLPWPGRSHSTMDTNSTNWGGYIIGASGGLYEVFGEWPIPHVSNVPGGGSHSEYSGLWVGLDNGFISSDLLQAGSSHEIHYVSSHGTSRSYHVFIEFRAGSSGSAVIESNGPIQPGDVLDTEVWPCNANIGIDFTAPYGCFYFSNLTGNWTLIDQLPKPGGSSFVGDSAEWIMETPSINHQLSNLANFGSVQMTYAEAVDFSSNSSWVPFGYEPLVETVHLVDTFSNNIPLMTTSIVNADTIRYNWSAGGSRARNP
jgi:hypothetical protein